LLLFAAACLGHLVLLVGTHNWVYGLHLPRRLGDLMHLVHAGAFVGGVGLLWHWTGGDVLCLFRWEEPLAARLLLASYVTLCWGYAGVVLPIVTLRRWRRRPPAALVEQRSQVLDTVKQLGFLPIGLGREGFLTRLPGNQVFQVELNELTLELPRVPPAWDGLKILHISDLHLKGTPDRTFFRVVMDRCSAWEPDLVAVTGDIADSIHHQQWIIPVLGRLRWQCAALAILGNHDYWYDPTFIRRRLGRLRFEYLGNSWRQLTVRGEPMLAIGNEAPWSQPPPDLSDCPAGPFRLCLSHTPDNIRWARRHAIDLMLAGHVHGGQICLPIVGPVFMPSRYGRRYDCGLFQESPTLLHVSRGLSGEHPLRFNCRPQATLLTLRTPTSTTPSEFTER
jgi:predicted MPP superfamily phosphohydrolase